MICYAQIVRKNRGSVRRLGMIIPFYKGEHRGGIPHKGAYYIGCGRAAKHLVYLEENHRIVEL